MSPDQLTLRPDFPGKSVLARGAAIALVLVLAACASRRPAPVEERSTIPQPPQTQATKPAPAAPPAEVAGQTYTVKKGDTLYAIALDHGLDYRELAAWNNLENINVIRTGQVLRLTAPGQPAAETSATGVTTTPLKSVPPVGPEESRGSGALPTAQGVPLPHTPLGARNTDVLKVQPKALKEPYTEQAWRDAQRMLPPPAASPAPEIVAAARRRRPRRASSPRASRRRPRLPKTTRSSAGCGPPTASSSPGSRIRRISRASTSPARRASR